MKILLCTNEDLVGSHILNLMLPALAGKHEMGVWLSGCRWLPKVEAAEGLSELDAVEYRLPVQQLFPTLDLVETDATQLRAWSERGGALTFEGIARAYGVLMQRWGSIQTPQAVAAMQGFAPDLVISMRYGAIFKDMHIAVPKFGIWNVHSGRLPEYRGVMATFRALSEGRDAGITLHRVPDATIDTGAPMAERVLRRDEGRSMLWHVRGLYPLARDMVLEALEWLEQGRVLPQRELDVSASRYFSYPDAAEILALERQGHRLFEVGELCEWFDAYTRRDGRQGELFQRRVA